MIQMHLKYVFNSLVFDNKLEPNYLWSFKSDIQNKTIASTLGLRGSSSFIIVLHTKLEVPPS